MKVKISFMVLKAVDDEIQSLSDESLMYFKKMLERINTYNLSLDEWLRMKILERLENFRFEEYEITLYEMRAHKGKGSHKNVRAILCGIEKGEKAKFEKILYVVKVWKKDKQKITRKIMDVARKRAKEMIKVIFEKD